MEQWPTRETDATKSDFMNHLGHARDEEDDPRRKSLTQNSFVRSSYP
jgi:hypothetical protein